MSTPFEFWSPDLQALGLALSNDHMLNGFDAQGKNISPALAWKNAPAGTQSFALLVHDPDAPTGSGFWHWVLANMPASTQGLPTGAGSGEGNLPAGTVVGSNDYLNTGVVGAGGYGGPCPPVGHGKHHYHFTLYALGVPDLYQAAGIPKNGTAALHGFALNYGLGANVLGKASFVATFER